MLGDLASYLARSREELMSVGTQRRELVGRVGVVASLANDWPTRPIVEDVGWRALDDFRTQ